ncbi:hypothetical protein [Wenjunlia tyrosinilytica]|uniref:Uncharacterized protein n=1 Tax=Wenjunlia tyrosinilytica TaxID=1544741 RepID=A0A917ZZ82_9ACTN|nr:hypothetical protein [Wenjunlia tyrosinilytica]GGO98535.1 hypothetical protein GCM10012280_62900 [Wenjunlia tyrosinilytica]
MLERAPSHHEVLLRRDLLLAGHFMDSAHGSAERIWKRPLSGHPARSVHDGRTIGYALPDEAARTRHQ